ncbi:MAG: hypothetical protein WAM30_14420 [Candidatus Dormiibacterota bacterium]
MREPAHREPDPRGAPRCPSCGSRDLDLLSLFGTQAMTLQYRCRECRTPFEAIKYEDDAEAGD